MGCEYTLVLLFGNIEMVMDLSSGFGLKLKIILYSEHFYIIENNPSVSGLLKYLKIECRRLDSFIKDLHSYKRNLQILVTIGLATRNHYYCHVNNVSSDIQAIFNFLFVYKRIYLTFISRFFIRSS